MFSPSLVLLAIFAYVGFLFIVALLTEQAARRGHQPSNHPVVYSLSLAVYCTTWTYYGSVGIAATSGLTFLSVYLGPTLALVFGWFVMRRMVLIKNKYHVPSVADLISVRYGKSQSIASLATIVALVGVTPYIALQLKAILSTFKLLVSDQHHTIVERQLGPLVVALMTVFTIVFGVRRIDPTERHQGVVMAVAVESVVKLVAFLAVGAFVTFGLFDGFGDILHRFASHPRFAQLVTVQNSGSSYMVWMSYIILSMSAFLLLPRQFHVAVVENFDVRHIRTSMWMFPIYMLLINIFVLPIALAGVLTGKSVETADTFVLQLPLDAGQGLLSLLVFLGGFSAATAMIMICSLSLSTMVSNHLFTPLFEKVAWLGFLRSRLLQCRWLVVALVIAVGYGFEIVVGESSLLVSMGIISFAAVLQLGPAVLGGLFWERGTRLGALLGMVGGFALWFYTLLLPAFVKSGWIAQSFLHEGPFGISLLAPEQLLGVTVFDPVSHAVFWSLLVNVALYVGASCVHGGSESERADARQFFDAVVPRYKEGPIGGVRDISLKPKRGLLQTLLEQYLTPIRAREVIAHCLNALKLERETHISVLEFTRLCSMVESALAGAIGTPAAHSLFVQSNVYTSSESETLSEAYGKMLASLRIPPEELQRRIDYHKERESLLAAQAVQLESQVELYESEIEQRRLVESALRESEAKFRDLFDSAPAGIAITALDGTLLSYNAAFGKMFGLEHVDAGTAVNVKSFYRNAARDRLAIIALIREKGQAENFESEMVDLSGKSFPASLSARQIQYEGATCFLSIIQDFTKINEMEARLRDYAENLKRMVDEKTQALQTANEELSAAIASLEETRGQLGRTAHQAGMAEIAVSVLHNIGNAVTWINVKARGLLDNMGVREIKNLDSIHARLTQGEAPVSDERASEPDQLLEFMQANIEVLRRRGQNLESDLRSILNGMNHIMEIISVQQKYVGLAGEETGQDLNELVRDAAEMLFDSLEKREIDLQLDLHDLPVVELNRNKMIQIITNILKNAYEAIDMSSVGVKRIVIRTSRLVVGDNEVIQVEVTDTGIGVKEADRASLFRFGFSTKERGTGYGLHDAANYIRARHGSIDLDSEGIGRGTRVVIRLPALGKPT